MDRVATRFTEALSKWLSIEPDWQVREASGFRWWPWHLSQRIWIDPMAEVAGVSFTRVHIATDMFREMPINLTDEIAAILASMNSQGTLSAYVLDGARLYAHCAMNLSGDLEPWQTAITVRAMQIQFVEAHARAQAFAEFLDWTVDESGHPSTGVRDIAHPGMWFTDKYLIPAGRDASAFTHEDFAEVSALFSEATPLQGPDEGGFAAAVPIAGVGRFTLSDVPKGFDAGRIAILESLPIEHPTYGWGALITLRVRATVGRSTDLMAHQLNTKEATAPGFPLPSLGAWCAIGNELAYASFMPNWLRAPGLLSILASLAKARSYSVDPEDLGSQHL